MSDDIDDAIIDRIQELYEGQSRGCRGFYAYEVFR